MIHPMRDEAHVIAERIKEICSAQENCDECPFKVYNPNDTFDTLCCLFDKSDDPCDWCVETYMNFRGKTPTSKNFNIQVLDLLKSTDGEGITEEFLRSKFIDEEQINVSVAIEYLIENNYIEWKTITIIDKSVPEGKRLEKIYILVEEDE